MGQRRSTVSAVQVALVPACERSTLTGPFQANLIVYVLDHQDPTDRLDHTRIVTKTQIPYTAIDRPTTSDRGGDSRDGSTDS